MRLQNIHIQNFRCIKDEEMDFDWLTAMVGRNGAGKSTFLHALNVFFNLKINLSEKDFYMEDISHDINIEVTFSELTETEKRDFSDYIIDNQLSVLKQIKYLDGKFIFKYYGYILGYERFNEIRSIGQVKPRLLKYLEIHSGHTIPDLPILPKSATAQIIGDTLIEWERNHPDNLIRVLDDGGTFGIGDTGKIKLDRYVRFILVPALRDASQDAIEHKGSPVTEIMDIVVRKAMESQLEYQRLQTESLALYRRIVAPDGGLRELNELEIELKRKLKFLAPGSDLFIDWDTDQEIILPQPQATIELEEDGFRTTVDRVGHGLQRAYIWSMLQQLSMTQYNANTQQTSNGGSIETEPILTQILPTILLAIEEVELYQHPTRQRYIAKILANMPKNTTDGSQTIQIIYSTHSPLFIDIEKFYQIRLLRKENNGPRTAKTTKVFKAAANIFLPAELIRLKTLMNPWVNEGFFARMIVLVEGDEDRGALLGMSIIKGVDLESMDIAIIPSNGKKNLPKSIRLFSAFSIPIYTIWDGDDCEKGRREEHNPIVNRKLLELNGYAQVDFPNTIIENGFSCFKNTLTATIEEEIGQDDYKEIMEEIKRENGIQQDYDVRKNPIILSELFRKASGRNKTCSSLNNIIDKIQQKVTGD
jgi:putative ATP-dependent endonuclease of the OLD family